MARAALQTMADGATRRPRRVLVIDDSVVARVMLAQVLEAADDFAVCAAFDRADRALEWLKTGACDLILLDLQLPGRSGLAALPDLIAACGAARIVVVSSLAAEGATASLSALSLGATDVVAKPVSGPIGRQFGLELLDRLRGLAPDVAVARERPPALPVREAPSFPVACVAIGASTGGIHALARLLAVLPATFDAPLLITQHLPAPFMPFFAEQLAAMARRPCTVARDGAMIERGTVIVAPGDGHLGVARTGGDTIVAIMRQPMSSRCLPSVDPMFESVGAAYGAGAVGIVLSGMGRDGCEGAAALVGAGGTILAQDCASATIWGMPGSVARAGLASMVASPEQIAEHLVWRAMAR